MNNKIKKFSILFIIILLLIPINFASDGDYTIPEATVDINVYDDGTTIITETITQDIEGTVNGVYREIPLKKGQSISNISIETPGYYNSPEIIRKEDNVTIRVWLYKNKEKTQKIYNDKVTVIYKYEFNHLVKLHNDTAELQFISWGEYWDSSVDKLTTYIHISNGKTTTEYWNNPPKYVSSSQWIDDNTLKTELTGIDKHTKYEQRVLIPKDYFKTTDKLVITNVNAKEKIEQDQKKYLENIELKNKLSEVLNIILAVLLFVPALIYAKFGRSPKIDYNSKYEYDIPTNDSSLFVNNILSGDVGQFNINAYNATLLNLIDKKYYKVIISNNNDTIIRRTDKDINGLKQYELDIIDFLNQFSSGDISFNKLKNECTSTYFNRHMDIWKTHARQEIPEDRVTNYFENKGYKLLRNICIMFIIISTIAYITLQVKSAIVLAILSVILLIQPNTFAGRWTKTGKEFHDKWMAFKNYIKDYSMINEYPPASIQVWGKYLIYATALGCADEVSKNMVKYFNNYNYDDNYINQSEVVFFSYYGGLNHMSSLFDTISSDDSNSISSIGGGSGGGGGGTF